MTRIIGFLFCLASITVSSQAQTDLGYFLPGNVDYATSIPTPASVIGHPVGEWHLTHDKLVQYMYALDAASDRIKLDIAGYTHEDRPLINLIITSPQNHQRLEEIRQQHVTLCNPLHSAALDIKKMPAVFYMGFSVHGNEASGTNASVVTAYYLAAAQGKEIDAYLNDVVIILDPCLNPDGMQRFSSWVNARKSKHIATDPNDTEHNEAWPGGRFNHYWFDLNRDWLVTQQPESQSRVKTFHHWKPNVLTDHHEMGTNETFFFQPGVPSRNHPLTPPKNYELTKRMAAFHARALDEIGSLYYTQEDFDDFYYGKGSTFPDVQGAIGILFEQGSSRGHAQESVNGILRFEFAIRNHVTTSLSSLKAVHALRKELLSYQRQFYKDAATEADKDAVKSIVFGSASDKAKAVLLAEVLSRQQIKVYPATHAQTINGKNFDKSSSFVIPLQQEQYKLIKGMFENRTTFEDSIFYDISGWTLPLAFGVDYDELKSVPAIKDIASNFELPKGERVNGTSKYAYVFEASPYHAHRALFRLLKQGVRVKVATEEFYNENGKKFERGALLIPISEQERSVELIEHLMNEITSFDGVDVYAFNTGLDLKGVSLGSGQFQLLKKPEVAMIIGEGISATDAGEIWHLMDTRMDIPLTLISSESFNRANLSRYTTIILPPTNGTLNISESGKEKLKQWLQNGGILIGFENALVWLTNNGIGRFEMKKDDPAEKKPEITPRPYATIKRYTDAQTTSGAIFEATADLTHPLLYGYRSNRLSIFKTNNFFMEKTKNAYGNPLVYTGTPLQSGYISRSNFVKVKESAIAGVTAVGQGRVIGFTDNLCFRAFWFGSNKLLMNAIFFGPIISNASSR